ncbi:MAG: hypothetical protein H6976_16385 [Gammaproteobacteria bacterium]|nr:hypothetical protein [Gammaproteobacteria bacterium]
MIGELECARRWQDQTIGLKHRELEQAVVATFLHSQPIGRTAKLKELTRLIGPTRPDKINLEKGLRGWAEDSHWLDDQHTDTATDATLPKEWRLGNRPNLKHMHDQAEKDIVTDVVKDRLEKEIGKLKTWFQVPPGLGVRLHLQPKQPSDIEDDGAFHFAILGPNTASEASDPSPDAVRFLTEKTGPNTPRAYPNAIVLVVPSRDGCGRSKRASRIIWLGRRSMPISASWRPRWTQPARTSYRQSCKRPNKRFPVCCGKPTVLALRWPLISNRSRFA